MPTKPASGLPPSLIVSSRDLARLEALLDSPVLSRHPAALALMDELNRAEVLPPEQIPPDVVTMHSRVECEDVANGEEHVLTLSRAERKNAISPQLWYELADGADWNLALGCDFVVAAPESRFCQVFSKRGLSVNSARRAQPGDFETP